MKTFIKNANFGVSFILILVAIGLALIALPFWGNRSLIVRSGSMQPTINVGDLIVVSPNSLINSPVPAITAKYKVGDIVAFQESASPETIVTHRVVGAEIKDGQVMYQTKGDANSVADQTMINEKNIIGRSQLTIPHVGKVFAFTKSKVGYPLLIILPALLVILLEINNIFKELTKKKFLMRGSLRDKININGLQVFIPFIAFALIFQNSHSFFLDTATSQDNVFQAAESFGPPIAQTLVMNELLPLSTENQGNDNCQFLELWNGSGATVSLQDFKLTDGVIATPIAVVNSNTDLPNGQFAILVKSNGLIQQCDALANIPNGTVTANFGGQVDLNTGSLQLLDADDNVMDTVLWGSSPNPTPSTNESIERDPTGLDSALGTNFEPSDFIVRTTPTPGS